MPMPRVKTMPALLRKNTRKRLRANGRQATNTTLGGEALGSRRGKRQRSCFVVCTRRSLPSTPKLLTPEAFGNGFVPINPRDYPRLISAQIFARISDKHAELQGSPSRTTKITASAVWVTQPLELARRHCKASRKLVTSTQVETCSYGETMYHVRRERTN